MLLVPICISGAAWLWLVLAHGRFWRSGPVLHDGVSARRLTVAVIIPARDEAAQIEMALRSLLAQQLEADLRIVLVDDNSRDGTEEIAEALAQQDVRLRVVSGSPLETGWTGKMWAVAQGLLQPEVAAADYVLLTDADIVHGPGHLQALVAHAEHEQLGLLSEMVRLRCETLPERALLPAFVFFFQMLYPFAWVNDHRRRTAAAAGGTMLLSQRALQAVDGVSRIRAALIDDVALAQQVKAAGFAIWLGHGDQVQSERRYNSFGEVWEMIARTAYVQLRYSPWLLVGTSAGMALLYVTPVVATIFGRGVARWLGAGCWAAMALAFQPTLRRYRRSSAWGLMLPGIAAFYTLATLHSSLRFYRGNGGRWKDRTYALGR